MWDLFFFGGMYFSTFELKRIKPTLSWLFIAEKPKTEDSNAEMSDLR